LRRYNCRYSNKVASYAALIDDVGGELATAIATKKIRGCDVAYMSPFQLCTKSLEPVHKHIESKKVTKIKEKFITGYTCPQCRCPESKIISVQVAAADEPRTMRLQCRAHKHMYKAF
jgi:DNA-directed RNA polymerase subunit M/transcription elongation factor TFIIS